MSHIRKVIRDDVVTSLTGLTTTGTNVYDTRIFPVAQASLPCLAVSSESEEIEEHTLNGSLSRSMVLSVTAYARATASIEDKLDTIAAEVEAAFSPGSSAKYWTLEGVEFSFDGEGDNQFASMAMMYRVLYLTARSNGETAL